MSLKLFLALAALAPAGAKNALSQHAAHFRKGRHMRLVADGGDQQGQLKSEYAFYHTSQELQSEVARLASSCSGAMSLRTVNQSGVSLDVVRLRKPGAQPVNRVFIVFGEHSRELISPESGHHLLRVLCGDAPGASGAPSPDEVLQDSEFEMVLNGNPRSRTKVEEGQFCLRTNPNGVDLNRNWDEMFSTEGSRGSNVYPGPHPWSEPETQILKDLVTQYNPTTFLSVHSGTRGMYMPWAYDTEHLAQRNQPEMLELLRTLDETHCQCPFGAAGKEVGYSCPGTSIDWVYDKLQTPYSFAFEIYTSPEYEQSLQARWQSAVQTGGHALLQEGHHLGHPHFLDLFQTHASDFVAIARRHEAGLEDMEPTGCFAMFNPDTKERYDATVENWAATYMEMSQRIARNLRNAQAANSTAP